MHEADWRSKKPHLNSCNSAHAPMAPQARGPFLVMALAMTMAMALDMAMTMATAMGKAMALAM
ncbi:MAG: hypothetical protein QF521_25920, partial [Alphaproteobacteria bacterium]|nr:hypothetical protein [Alphaproteobacteria bacterium]